MSNKKRLVLELTPACINQLKWVAMKRRISVTHLIGAYSTDVFLSELPPGADARASMVAMADNDKWSEVPFEDSAFY
jgi:hypothetical protein